MSKSKPKFLSSIAGYHLAADGYDKKEKYLNSFEQGKILPLLKDIKDAEVLDIGAGTGRLALELSNRGAKVTALDVSENMLAVLKRKDAGRKIVTAIGDAEDLPLDDAHFDIVIATFLIVHLKNPTRFFDEVYRVLKDGGIFLVTNINQKDPPVVSTQKGDIVIESYYHRPEKIREILESLAFGIEQEIFVKEKDVWVNQILVCRK